MEPEGRGPGPALIERIRDESRRFEFAQAAVLLHRVLRAGSGTRGIRYRGDRSLRFPASEIELESLPDPGSRDPGTIRVSFFGLAGMLGVLPSHYAELLEERRRAGDPGLGRFLAIFEDRLIRLFLHAHLRHRPWLRFAWNRGLPSPQRGAIEEILLALVGTATTDLRDRVGLPEDAQLHYTGLLAQQPRSSAALRSVIEDYFGTPARIDEYRGRWVAIPPASTSRLGARHGSALGTDLIAGDRYFDPAYGVRIAMGPMSLPRFQSLLPRTPGAEVLERFTRFALGGEKSFEFDLVLRARDVPPARLTHDADAPQRLGWSLWLQSGDEVRDAVAGPFAGRPIDEPDTTGR